MSDDSNRWSEPDYDGWKDIGRDWPSPRFYFFVTVVALTVIAAMLVRDGGHWMAAVSIAVLILIFGATVFFMQWKRDGNDQISETESGGSARLNRRDFRT